MIKSESIAKLSPALLKAQSEMGNAVKDSKNPFFKSKYADLNAVREACMPALHKHGISVLQPTVVVDGKNYVQTLLLHESGEYLGSLTEVKVTKANDAQAEGSGISYARRYGLSSLLNLGAEDDDGERTMDRTSKVTTTLTSGLVTAPNIMDVSQSTGAVGIPTEPKKSSSFRKPSSNGNGKSKEIEGWE